MPASSDHHPCEKILHIPLALPDIKNKIPNLFRPFNPKKIILFGSCSWKGEAWDEFSDIDLIIIYETPKSFLDRLKELYLAWDIPRPVDILAYTPDEFKTMVQENAFVQDAVNKGEVLYECP
jgi:predicted nucleotidyltransferase